MRPKSPRKSSVPFSTLIVRPANEDHDHESTAICTRQLGRPFGCGHSAAPYHACAITGDSRPSRSFSGNAYSPRGPETGQPGRKTEDQRADEYQPACTIQVPITLALL